MPEPKQKPKPKPQPETNQRPPSRHEVEAEVPQPAANEPLAESTPIDGTRGPRVRLEPEVE